MLEAFAIAAAIFVVGVTVHFVVTHVAHSHAYVRNAYLTYILTAACALPITLRLGFVGFVLVYLCSTILWNSYLIFFINLQNSVSLRMIAEVDRSPLKSLTFDELLAVYPDETQLTTRLEALRLNGMLIIHDNHELELTAKGAFLAKTLARLRALIGLETFG